MPDKISIVSACAGLLMACSLPLPDFSLLAWFGLVPLFLCMQRRPFKSGFIAGLFFFAATLYWVNIVMTTYGYLPVALSFILYLLLSAYLALYWGVATWAASRLKEFRGYSYAMTLPVLWVAMEFLRSLLLTGFPWATIGYSQQSWLTMIQSTDLFGVYGISYLLILSNTVIVEFLLFLRRREGESFSLGAAAFFFVLVAGNYSYGHWCLQQNPDERTKILNVGLIQGNIPQDLKWHPDNQKNTVNIYRDLSLRAERAGAKDLLVWPEAAMPFYFQDGGELADAVRRLPIETETPLLFGSPAYRNDSGSYRYLNSAYMLTPSGEVAGRSDKIHLVPFGEYVPLGTFLPFVNKLVAGVGDYSPGEINPLPIHGDELGVLVCYEIIFPELAREYVRQGSDVLVNITNDAWFGNSSAPWQHLAMARYRAVENRVWLLRVANTGVTALISPSGKVIQQTKLFETAFLVGQAGIGAKPRIYAQLGDLIPTLFVLIGLIWLLQTRRRFL